MKMVYRVMDSATGRWRWEAAACLLPVAALTGAVLTFGYYQVPNRPDQYVVNTKERCLTKDGVPLRLSYNGRGTVDILVLPPATPASPEKEKKK